MRIGIDARFLDSKTKTGVANYLKSLIFNLARIDRNNEYILYFNSLKRKKGEFPRPMQDNFDARVIKLPNFSSVYFNQIWPILLSMQMKKDKIDVAHLMPSAFPKNASFKTVSTVHDLTSYRYPNLQNMNHDFNFFKKMLERTVTKADMLIAISEVTRQDLMAYFLLPKPKIEVVHLGTELKKTDISPNELKEFKQSYGLAEHNILFVGSFEKRKNIEVLLQAFSHLLNSKKILHKLVLVGNKGSSYENILRLITSLGIKNSVVLTGYIPDKDLPNFYYSSDALVFPSLYEGFGLPCVEAMSLGIPLIMSDIPVFHEVAKDAGLYFNPNNYEELSGIIYKLTSDEKLRMELVNKGLLRSKEFTWINTARKTLDLYKSL